jgi:peptide/nickel transport system substrate-binding protein
MNLRKFLSANILCGVIAAGCAPGAREAAPGGQAAPQTTAAPKAITMALDFEPAMVAWNLGASSVKISDELRLAAHGIMSGYDDRGEIVPMLAAEVPSPDRGTWVVNSDGTMRTTYKLRPNLKWHDGTALTSKDFAFGWNVMKDPDVPSGERGVAQQIASVDTPDDLTVAINWKATYPFADALIKNEVGPMPSHLLQAQYDGSADKIAFTTLGYWGREFVGAGPYRIAEWEPGSHLTLKAVPDHYAHAKIDTLTVKFIASQDTFIANMISGAVDVSPRVLKTAQALTVKEQWEAQGKKPVAIVGSNAVRALRTQFRNPNPAVLSDVRVRQGLLQAIDRQSIADTLSFGLAPPADTFITTNDLKWDWVKDAVVRYPYDQRLAQATLVQAGLRLGSDGMLLTPSGERVSIAIRSEDSAEVVALQSIIGDNWKRVGVTGEQDIRSQAELRDRETNASYSAFNLAVPKTTFSDTTQMAYGSECPSAATRWSGNNIGCYQNPAYDRAVDGLRAAIDRNIQRTLYADYARILSQDLPLLPLYYTTGVTLAREGITGVKGETNPPSSVFWNIADWDVAPTLAR